MTSKCKCEKGEDCRNFKIAGAFVEKDSHTECISVISYCDVPGATSMAKSRSLSATAFPRAQELTIKTVSTVEILRKYSFTASAAWRCSFVGNSGNDDMEAKLPL